MDLAAHGDFAYCLRRYLSPEPLLQEPRYVQGMARRGLPIPSYAYAGNSPLSYVDPDGRDLHVAWSNYVFFDAPTIAKLERVVASLNSPSGKCSCALTSGYGGTPWQDRWISVVLDPGQSYLGNMGLTNPAFGIIYLDPAMDEDTMRGTLAHEGGHLRFPYAGHGDRGNRFDNPDYHCGGAKTQPYLHTSPCPCN